ncbi:hypothetical protein CCR81_01645 [Halorhodospira halophila]|nr:hypothetical protein [Halorhodospira halophila]
MLRHAEQQRPGGQADDGGGGEDAQVDAIQRSAQPDHCRGTAQGGDAVVEAEAAVAQIEGGADRLAEQRDEEGLPEAGESRGQQTESEEAAVLNNEPQVFGSG